MSEQQQVKTPEGWEPTRAVDFVWDNERDVMVDTLTGEDCPCWECRSRQALWVLKGALDEAVRERGKMHAEIKARRGE